MLHLAQPADLLGRLTDVTRDPGRPLVELEVAEHVVEAQQALEVGDRGELGRVGAAHPLRRGVRGPQRRVLLLDRLELAQLGVVLGVALGRGVEDVVAVLLLVDHPRELDGTFPGRRRHAVHDDVRALSHVHPPDPRPAACRPRRTRAAQPAHRRASPRRGRTSASPPPARPADRDPAPTGTTAHGPGPPRPCWAAGRPLRAPRRGAARARPRPPPRGPRRPPRSGAWHRARAHGSRLPASSRTAGSAAQQWAMREACSEGSPASTVASPRSTSGSSIAASRPQPLGLGMDPRSTDGSPGSSSWTTRVASGKRRRSSARCSSRAAPQCLREVPPGAAVRDDRPAAAELDRGRQGPRTGQLDLERPRVALRRLLEGVEVLTQERLRPADVTPRPVGQRPPRRPPLAGEVGQQAERASGEVRARPACWELRQEAGAREWRRRRP